MSPDQLLIGAHTSAQGGPHNALLEGQEIGATTIQLFTANQKTWNGKKLTEEAIALWEQSLESTGIKNIMSHDSYLINLGSPNPEGLQKSRHAFKEELHRCHQLKITFLNFHPGAALDSSEEACLQTIVESLLELESLASQGPTRLLLESTAGQGSSVGNRFEHLAYIVDRVHHKIPIGVCVDTCHAFAAGYDISTLDGWKKVIKEFDQIVGLKHLYALHVNDSLKPLGSEVDRHAPLGKGLIGIECFKTMMELPELRELPKYLETPDGPPLWKEEIKMLREFA
ncbi:MAG: deoxyribonuclease IV [Verrucomicrobia bacterium]|nr:deoxyribonuclease IV [Verrucomicrobiota bacterium]